MSSQQLDVAMKGIRQTSKGGSRYKLLHWILRSNPSGGETFRNELVYKCEGVHYLFPNYGAVEPYSFVI